MTQQNQQNNQSNPATEFLKSYIGGQLLEIISLSSEVARLKEELEALKAEKKVK